jgi:hypothetical protein
VLLRILQLIPFKLKFSSFSIKIILFKYFSKCVINDLISKNKLPGKRFVISLISSLERNVSLLFSVILEIESSKISSNEKKFIFFGIFRFRCVLLSSLMLFLKLTFIKSSIIFCKLIFLTILFNFLDSIVISGEIQILLTVSKIIALSIKFNFAY